MELLSVLVVDDEDVIREGLCNYIPWEEHGFRLAGSAHDGREALEFLHTTHVDLLITDIQMPDVSGLDLIAQAAAEKLDLVALLVTGYDEFDYAQQAIRSKIVYDYLLKPINRREFVKLLDAIREEITEKRRAVTLPALEREDLSRFEAQEAARLHQVVNLVKQGDADRAAALWGELWRGYLERGYSLALLKRCCWEFTLQLGWALAQWGLDYQPEEGDPLSSIARLPSPARLEDYCAQLIRRCAGRIAPQMGRQLSPVVKACVDIIRAEYGDSALSLQSLSERLSVSANYLSSCFKKEVGIGFLKYLNSLRISKAQELLQDVHLRTYEVANRVGVEDQRYFSRLFKELTGMSPSEYRSLL